MFGCRRTDENPGPAVGRGKPTRTDPFARRLVPAPMIDALEALRLLREGNRRFAEGRPEASSLLSAARRDELLAGQRPFAVVLGCSDSRVPVEMIFDQGCGDLFVIRVAGNLAAPTQIASVEFAVGVLGVRLAVVLGHSRCGAVTAALDRLQGRTPPGPACCAAVVDRILPVIEQLPAAGPGSDPERSLREAVRANVRASARSLRTGSGLLEQAVGDGGLIVVGAEYSLENGLVDFFDGVPA